MGGRIPPLPQKRNAHKLLSHPPHATSTTLLFDLAKRRFPDVKTLTALELPCRFWIVFKRSGSAHFSDYRVLH